jgi:ATP-dependent protease ClpP protease subunit
VETPQVRLLGSIDDDMLSSFLDQMARAREGEGPIAVEVTTTGGDAETGRRIALELKLARRRLGRRILFIGKTAVYSAGATIMSAFPVEDRYLSEDTMLLVHCRKLEKTLELEGPLRASRQRVNQLLSEIETGLRLERQGFADLIEGSRVTMAEVEEKAAGNWYIPAEEAVERRLVAAIV